ncbi:MAG TPA: MBL fold metallo-hydrolase [Chlamydiales bacterium]|nr:MAG: Zn-dependent hydrolase [Verrucomicrobia bacterium RIFCSPHIGHO2_12_FULL_41_10]HLB52229.1 MBL fold metallo-hydrolase [Chlamydiales bacterium]
MYGFCPLASGSKGNAIFLGTKKTRILIDAGGSLLSLQKRLSELDVAIETLDAVLVTHEHIDHIQALCLLSERYQVPIFANAETAKGIVSYFKERATSQKFKIFTTGETFSFADLEIHPFSIPHDTLDPVGFTIRHEGLKLGFCADLGMVTPLVRKELQGCRYLYVEANHQPSMVHSSHRPAVYKERVLGKQGHLSNEECRDLILSVYNKDLQHIHLAHLSSECNVPELALRTVQEGLHLHGQEVDVSIAYQDRVSKPIHFEI